MSKEDDFQQYSQHIQVVQEIRDEADNRFSRHIEHWDILHSMMNFADSLEDELVSLQNTYGNYDALCLRLPSPLNPIRASASYLITSDYPEISKNLPRHIKMKTYWATVIKGVYEEDTIFRNGIGRDDEREYRLIGKFFIPEGLPIDQLSA